MKKTLLLSAVVLLAVASCKKKDQTPDDKDPFILEYSAQSIEQNKETIEQNGVEFLSHINTLPDEVFIDALSNLGDLNPEIVTSSVVGKQLLSIGLAASKKDVSAIFASVTDVTVKNNTNRLSDFYGIYTWNKNTQDWVKTTSTTKLEILYPAFSSSTSNNAVITITYTAASTTATVEGETYELPATVNASLTVNNKEELKLTSRYEYQSDGVPTKTEVDLTLGSFTFKTLVQSNSQIVTSQVSLAKGKVSLFNLSTEANGNANVTAFENADRIEDVLKNANATFEVMNIKLVGQVDAKAIGDAELAASNLSELEQNKKSAEAYNKNAKLVAVYKAEKTIIAKVEFVPVSDSYSYTYWDGSSNITETYTDYYIEPRLVFNDGSKLSMDTFFESGFSRLIDDLERYADRF